MRCNPNVTSPFGTGTAPVFPPLPYPTEVHDESERKFFVPVSMLAAPEGEIFIGGSQGELLMGTAEEGFVPLLLPEIDRNLSRAPLEGLAWYKGNLWAVNGSQLLRLTDGTWVPQRFFKDEDWPMGFKFIDESDGALLVGSQYRAALFDATKWRRVFGSRDPEDWLPLKLRARQHDDMSVLHDIARNYRQKMR